MFLNNLGLHKIVEQGYDGFLVEQGEIFDEIIAHYSRKGSLFEKVKPEEFSYNMPGVTFSKEELERAPYYALNYTGESLGDPQPMDSFMEDTFSFDCELCLTGRKQKSLVRMKKPKLKKKQVNFTLRDYDILFFKKIFLIRC